MHSPLDSKTDLAAVTKASSDYRADIDGLRAAAVLAVVFFHAFPDVLKGGFVGVDIFFVISGILITGIICERGPEKFSFLDFYFRRVRRIFPALTFILAATFLIGWFLLFASEFSEIGRQIVAGAGFAANFLFWKEAGYFDTASDVKPLLHLWSLGVEEQFYIFWPAAVYFGWKRDLGLLYIIVVAGLISFAINIVQVHRDPIGAFYSPLTRFWELMMGASLAAGRVGLNSTSAKNICSIIGLMMIALSISMITPSVEFPGWAALGPTIGSALLIVSGKTGLANRALSFSPLVGIGLISYPFYLWHWPLLVLVRLASHGQSQPGLALTTILLSLALAAGTFALIERPIRALPLKLPTIVALAIAVMSMGTIGWLACKNDGFAGREANRYALFMAHAQPPKLNDGSCERLLGLSLVVNEYCVSNSAQPQYLLLGDSHAMVLNAAASSGMIDMKTVMIAGNTCLPFLHYITKNAG
ncbi:acyltransferase family protein, partial [Bradyrhizobium sp.]|uniref:acyltransferase family protein n=1 Tax=Bradyrhizobium sp. TaxID=376 RepID=UPI003C13B5B8